MRLVNYHASPVQQVGNRGVSLGRTEIFENSTFHSWLLLTRNCPLRSFSLQWATVTAEIHNWSTCCGVHECSALHRTYVSTTEHTYQPHAGEHHRRGVESKSLHQGPGSYGYSHSAWAWSTSQHEWVRGSQGPTPIWRPIGRWWLLGEGLVFLVDITPSEFPVLP